MASNPIQGMQSANKAATTKANNILHSLVAMASSTANAQLDAFTERLADALKTLSHQSTNDKESNLSFKAAHLLQKNSYVFYYLASARLEKVLLGAVEATELRSPFELVRDDGAPSLGSYTAMEKKSLLGRISRPIEMKNTDQLVALGARIAHLLARKEMTIAQNPFRPEVFLSAINDAWCEFNPDKASHPLALPLMRPDVFLDLSPILQALNDTLIGHDILPELAGSCGIKKSTDYQDAGKKEVSGATAVSRQLQHPIVQAPAVDNQLLGYLTGIQKSMFEQPSASDAGNAPHRASILTGIKNQAPQGTLTQADENSLDLLTKVFGVVFSDRNIPAEIKTLIGFLQVPMLKAALLDKEFFFKEDHPARRLLELLAESSVAWDQKKGQGDPLYQTIERTVKRVQQEFDQQTTVFSDVVADLESLIKEEEAAVAKALSAPITKALQQEKLAQATKAAKHEVALRIGTGEVVAFVEAFLANKWVPVLTLAYSMKDEKPQAVENAIKTMDDLVWSVKPKITPEQRKELITRLPSVLENLNKWLNLAQWEEAERAQFFAELAKCHASIVRAPLELSPQRQLEISIEVAKQAAERRQQRRDNTPPEPVSDKFTDAVDNLQRGTWLEFTLANGSARKVKLAWVSPMRSLYIFTSQGKQEAFSISAEELAQTFRTGRAQVVLLGGVVERALIEALGNVGANDAVMNGKASA